MDVSVIDKVNQSSFISDNGKKLLIDDFGEDNVEGKGRIDGERGK